MYTPETLKEIARTIRLYKGEEDYIAAKLDYSADAWQADMDTMQNVIEVVTVLYKAALTREAELAKALAQDRLEASIKKAEGG